MSVNLICYTTLPLDDCQDIINKLRGGYDAFSSQQFWIYDARVASEVEKEIAMDHNLNPQSTFVFSPNSDDEDRPFVMDVADDVREAMGGEGVILILHDNGYPI